MFDCIIAKGMLIINYSLKLIKLRNFNFPLYSFYFNEITLHVYLCEKHIIEGALKERHLKGQSVRAVIFVDIGAMRSEGPTPKVIVFRCRTYGALQITYLQSNSPYGLPY